MIRRLMALESLTTPQRKLKKRLSGAASSVCASSQSANSDLEGAFSRQSSMEFYLEGEVPTFSTKALFASAAAAHLSKNEGPLGVSTATLTSLVKRYRDAENGQDLTALATSTKAIRDAARMGHTHYDPSFGESSQVRPRKFWLSFTPPKLENLPPFIYGT